MTTTYARRLGLFSGTMAVIGGIIGGGIFRTPAAVAERLASPGPMLAAWIAGGAVALIGALCFGELGQRRPKAGGGYVYLRETWGPLPAFLYGWALLLVIASGAVAAVAVTFADYALALTGLPSRLTVPVALGAIVLLTGVNYLGVRAGAITQNLFTILKLAALVVLIVVGVAAALPESAPAASAALETEAGPVLAFGSALVPILFTYGGWQQTNFIAEEIVEPERNLPRALVLGVAVVVLVYLLANVAYLRVLGAAGLAGSTAPAADAMHAVLGPAGGTLIAAGIAVSSFGFLNLVILVTPRVFQAMAADGLFFSRLARLHPVHRTPGAALVLLAGWACVLTLSGTFAQLVDYVTFADWIFFGLTVAGLYVYRSRDPSAGEGAFRVPGYPWTPAIFIAAAALVVVSTVMAGPRNAAIGAGLLGLGVPVYWYWRGSAGRRTGAGVDTLLLGQTQERTIEMIEQKRGNSPTATGRQTEVAVLAGGCFWGVEEILRAVPGVLDTDVGYTGGWLPNPTYDDTHDSKSGHAESVRVTFDPTVLSYEELLEKWFFRLHDPTTLNRQGNDVGTQYRSAIFPQTPEQREIAERVKARVEASGKWKRPITTTIEPAGTWYSAEGYHQDYLQKHPNGYTCHWLRE